MPNFRRQDVKNRQNSFDDHPETLASAQNNWGAVRAAYNTYERLLRWVARETARRVAGCFADCSLHERIL